jgi:predicted nucleic acid-binding protein
MLAKVVDASVIAAMLFNEDNASTAADLTRDAQLFAPQLLPFELSSVARRLGYGRPLRKK